MWLAVEFFISTGHSHFQSNHAKIKQFKIYMTRYYRVVADEMGEGGETKGKGDDLKYWESFNGIVEKSQLCSSSIWFIYNLMRCVFFSCRLDFFQVRFFVAKYGLHMALIYNMEFYIINYIYKYTLENLSIGVNSLRISTTDTFY